MPLIRQKTHVLLKKAAGSTLSLVDEMQKCVDKERKSPRCPCITKLTHLAQQSAGAGNLARSAFMTHGPFSPDVPETGRSGTSLKSKGLCASSTASSVPPFPGTVPSPAGHSPLDLLGKGLQEMKKKAYYMGN